MNTILQITGQLLLLSSLMGLGAEDYKAALKSGELHLKNHDYQAARLAVDIAINQAKSPRQLLLARMLLGRLAADENNYAEAAETYKQILASTSIEDKEVAKVLFQLARVLAQLPDTEAQVATLLETASRDERLSVEERYQASIIAFAILPQHRKQIISTSQTEAQKLYASGLTVDLQVAALHDAGKYFMFMRRYEVVRELVAATKVLYKAESKNDYHVPFMPHAPMSAEAWANSSLLSDAKNKESRFEEYDRKSAELLIYDVASERAVGEGATATKQDTSFYMAADDEGWHIYVTCQDAEAEKVAAGLLSGGSLEMYFKPAGNLAYYQWMVGLPQGKLNVVDWDGHSRHYRSLQPYVRSDVQVFDREIGAAFFFPWEMVYDKLPENGTAWQFGVIRWSRSGGMTWGGKVHEINKWGNIIWDGLTPENLVAIKRKIVMKALGTYNKSKGDFATFWHDGERGDRQFYNQVLAPELERLNKLGEQVTPQMSSATIEDLYVSAVPNWMEFPLRVGELRDSYLKKKLFSTDK